MGTLTTMSMSMIISMLTTREILMPYAPWTTMQIQCQVSRERLLIATSYKFRIFLKHSHTILLSCVEIDRIRMLNSWRREEEPVRRSRRRDSRQPDREGRRPRRYVNEIDVA